MRKSISSNNFNDIDDKSPDRIQRNLDQVTTAFPECPICKAAANYKISGMLKNIAVCEICNAGWTSHEFYDDSPLMTLALAKKGKYKELKYILNNFRSVEFWKHFDINAIDKDQIENLLNLYTGRDPEKCAESKQKLKDSDEIGLIEIRDIASGLQTSQSRLAALVYVASLKNESDLPLLIQALTADDGKYTRVLIDLFLDLALDAGFPQAIPPIIQVLRENEYPSMRAHAAEALGEIKGNQQVIEALAKSLYDTARLPQEEILAGSLNGFLVAAAKQKLPPIVREFAARSLIKIGDPFAVEALVNFELREGFGSNIEIGAENLRPLGPVVVEPLIKGLVDENERVRARSAGFLCFLGNEGAVEALIASLSDECVLVRSNSAYALGVIGDLRAVKPLKQFGNDSEAKVKKAVELALKKLNAL